MVAYVVFRILILIVLGVPGWIAPDIPLALFGLVLLDLPRSANHWRWPLAIGAVSSFQVAASLTGVSSVDPASVLRSAFVPAVIVALISLAILIRRPTARAALILLFALGAAVSTPSPDPSPVSDDCGGVCMPSHDMLGIFCVLALLAGVILFALHPALTGWPTLTRILRPLRLTVAALAPPNPPSLHVLSISRT